MNGYKEEVRKIKNSMESRDRREKRVWEGTYLKTEGYKEVRVKK